MDKNDLFDKQSQVNSSASPDEDSVQSGEPGTQRVMSDKFKIVITAIAFLVLFAGGIGGGYVFFQKKSVEPPVRPIINAPVNERGESAEIVVFFPSEGRLKSENREAQAGLSRAGFARATIEEFLKGPQSEMESYVPEGARLLGVYEGEDGIIYIDLSDSFRRNLRVDSITEYLLLRGIYESLLANVYGVADVKILIEGAEVETLAGHISLLRPLGDTVGQTIVEE